MQKPEKRMGKLEMSWTVACITEFDGTQTSKEQYLNDMLDRVKKSVEDGAECIIVKKED